MENLGDFLNYCKYITEYPTANLIFINLELLISNSLLAILTVRFSKQRYTLGNIKFYFKNFDQTNISDAFNTTRNKQKEVITAKEWPAFTKKFYFLQIELQSGFKCLIKYVEEKKEKYRQENKPISESWDYLKLKSAIKNYNNENYKSAYQLFRDLTCKKSENTTSEEGNQIYSIAMYYIALCSLNRNGTKKNENYTLSVPNFLKIVIKIMMH
ncbi:12253_t:CDS:1 [Gigaspora margarita]|uniref:12253_t:CDS:1 n=1 Tax=Gigaspora margarita TaxID=4874 RepID=A0ABN7V6Z0_GIGMA|nr:12253_t:CDS:1 [Gigaspora margarita]